MAELTTKEFNEIYKKYFIVYLKYDIINSP